VLDLAGLHLVLRGIHIAAGSLGLVAFWAAVFTKRGSTKHIRCGRVFVFCAYTVGITAVISSAWALVDSYGFGLSLGLSEDDIRRLAPERRWLFSVLGLAGIGLLAYIQVGVYAVKTKDGPLVGGKWMLKLSLVTFGIMGAGTAAFGIASISPGAGPGINSLMPAILGIVAMPLAYGKVKFVRRSRPTYMDWWYQHMECMLVSGISFHTALAITVSIRLMHQGLLDGPAARIPWVLPTVVGAPATWFWIRHYQIKSGGDPVREDIAAK
jgi:hypothetical protein